MKCVPSTVPPSFDAWKIKPAKQLPRKAYMLYALSLTILVSVTLAKCEWQNERALKTKLDISQCVPLVLGARPGSPIRISPLLTPKTSPCYLLQKDSRIFVFKPSTLAIDLEGFNEAKVVPVDLPGPITLTNLEEVLKSGITQHKNRVERNVERPKRSAGAPLYSEDDYDFNHLIPPSAHTHLSASDQDEQPDFGFRLASPLAQAGQRDPPQPPRDQHQHPQNYQNDQPPYQVDRRTQILPVPLPRVLSNASGSQIWNEPVGETLNSAKAGASEARNNNEFLRNKPVTGSRPPTLRNPLDQIRVHQGKVFRITVPANTFHDQADGDTRHLRLELYTIDKRPVTSDKKYAWIKFDPATQQFYGLPALANIGLHEFMLAAVNSAGLPVYNAFTIYVQPRPKGFRSADSDPGVNHKFWVVLDDAGPQGGPQGFGSDFRSFKRNVSKQVEFFDALAAYYTSVNGSSLAGANYSNFYDQIYLDSITRGSIRVAWLNDTLLSSSQGLPLEILAESVRARGNNYSSYGCPQADIEAIGSRFSADGSGRVNPAFRDAMYPGYNVRGAGYDLLHSCTPQQAPVVMPAGRARSKAAPARDPIASRDYERDLWMTTIIPSLVMALLLLIASLIACCLYRRRRKPRFMNEDRSLFKKGVPVVMYPDEFEDSSGPPIDTHPTISYHPQSQYNQTSQNMSTTITRDNLNGYNVPGSTGSPVNDPSASYPRPPPYNNQNNAGPYQPLLYSQTINPQLQMDGSGQRPLGPNVYSTLNAG